MSNIEIAKLIETCETIARRVTKIEGGAHGSSFLFNNCMRAFDCKPKPESVTFYVFINSPVMKPGYVTIHRDGNFEMHVDHTN